MDDNLSDELRELDELLLAECFPDDAMLLCELDGFLAGIVVCGDLIMPGEWLPHIWDNQESVFENKAHMERVVGLIMAHYNRIIADLGQGRYAPIYAEDNAVADDTPLWEIWVQGFWRAVLLRPREWIACGESEDKETQSAFFILTRLYEIANMAGGLAPEHAEIDEELEKQAPDLIPRCVEGLHVARLTGNRPVSSATVKSGPKIGRNDPCPCGSGKKFKKCCLNNVFG